MAGVAPQVTVQNIYSLVAWAVSGVAPKMASNGPMNTVQSSENAMPLNSER